MATVQVTFGAAMDGIRPVHAAVPDAKEDITSSGTSQATTITSAGPHQVCKVTSVGGAVWVAVGASPTASAGNDHLIPDGATLDLGFLQAGWAVAVIDA